MDLAVGHGVLAQCSLRMRATMAAFSRRSLVPQVANAFSQALARARAQERALLDLSAGNPTQLDLSPTADTLLPLLHDARVAHYEALPFGLQSAREAVASELSTLGFHVPATHVLLSASTSEAYGMLFKLLCDAGDRVLVPQPSYPLFDVLAALEGVQLVPYRLLYDGEWYIDRASLRAALASHPELRAILVVHPNNPTGSFLKRDELAFLASFGLPIVSDEVFSEYAFARDDRRAVSALEAADRTLVFRMAGLSKSLALPQLKLAYTAIAGPREVCEQARERLEHIADAYLSPSASVQLALPGLLALGATVRSAIAARVQHNLALLKQAVTGSAASVLGCEGGWYAIVRLPAVLSDEAWCLELLEHEALIVQPGYFFDLHDGAYVVLSLLAHHDVFSDGCARLLRCLSRYAPIT